MYAAPPGAEVAANVTGHISAAGYAPPTVSKANRKAQADIDKLDPGHDGPHRRYAEPERPAIEWTQPRVLTLTEWIKERIRL